MRCRGMMREPRSRMNWWRGRMKKSLAFLKLLCYDVKNNLKGRLYDERNGKQFRTQRRRT